MAKRLHQERKYLLPKTLSLYDLDGKVEVLEAAALRGRRRAVYNGTHCWVSPAMMDLLLDDDKRAVAKVMKAIEVVTVPSVRSEDDIKRVIESEKACRKVY